jgi:hypothetical protein
MYYKNIYYFMLTIAFTRRPGNPLEPGRPSRPDNPAPPYSHYYIYIKSSTYFTYQVDQDN